VRGVSSPPESEEPLIDGLDIEIVALDGSPLRRLILDPTKDYQRIP
jgi:hypothetical protein